MLARSDPMLSTGSVPDRVTPLPMSGPGMPGDRRSSRIEPSSRRFVLAAAVGVGVVSSMATEFMHHMLVPDLGRSQRLLAKGLSALIVSCLTAKLIHISRERHRLIMARMQVIAEMNHHLRNALSPISLSVDGSDNQHLIQVISEGVEHIDWALREILPRGVPLREGQRNTLGYFQTRRSRYQ